jgi:PKHD-type hydroxylase
MGGILTLLLPPTKWIWGEFSGKIRKLSVTINLSDPKDYKGGNLRFDFGPHDQKKRFHTCTEIRPRGSIIVFPSHVFHQVTPVTKGTRHSLVMWSLGLPFR